MKLLRRVERLAAGAGARVADVGISWSSFGSELDRELKPGEYLAVDVVEDAAGQGASRWLCSERATVDPHDLGIVRGVDGAVLGRVTARDGGLVTIEYGPPGEAPKVSIVEGRSPLVPRTTGLRPVRSGGGASSRRRGRPR